MALKPCLECEQPVSEDAPSCPHCGSKWPLMTRKEKNSAVHGITFLIVMFGVPLLVLLFAGGVAGFIAFILCSIICIFIKISEKITNIGK